MEKKHIKRFIAKLLHRSSYSYKTEGNTLVRDTSTDRILKYIDKSGSWIEYGYDENGNNITYKDSYGYAWEREVDNEGRTIKSTNYSGRSKYNLLYEYDEDGNEINCKTEYLN